MFIYYLEEGENIMDPIYVGFWSVIPPLISISFALIFKEIISSLLIGITAGTIIYSVFSNNNIVNMFEFIFSLLKNNMEGGVSVIIFTSLLGAISQIMVDSGSAAGYASWAKKRIKSPLSSQLLCIFLSFVCSIDDTFLSLTVGNIMHPITDKNKVSRAKLAYLIDMMSSQLCVLVPFSSWVSAIISCISGSNKMELFIKSIPFNFYAIFSVIAAIAFSFCRRSIGPMRKFEISASKGCDISASKQFIKSAENDEKNGKISDLILPIVILILSSLFMMVHTSGFFSEHTRDFSTLLHKIDMDFSITFGAFVSIIYSLLVFVPKKMSFEKFMSSVSEGIKSMTSTSLMLILAWSVSSICKDYLMINDYIKNIIYSYNISEKLVPASLFLLSSFLSFSIGSSWGTFTLLIPIVSSVFADMNQSTLILTISAILSGSIAGVNCSPISNAGILSALGAKCNHMDHISSQIPYALFTSFLSFISFAIIPFTNLLVPYLLSLSILILSALFINSKKPENQ